MKWLNRLAALLFGLISVGIARTFLEKYEVIVLDKDQLNNQDGDEEEEEMGDIIHLDILHLILCMCRKIHDQRGQQNAVFRHI